MNVPYNIDITWHYDTNRQVVRVTNVKVNIVRNEPQEHGGGFWDTFIVCNPNMKIPTEPGVFSGWDDSNGNAADLPNVKRPDDVWNKMFAHSNDVYAYMSQNNKTGEYSIEYNNQNFQPYDAIKNADGSWTLLGSMGRWNDYVNDWFKQQSQAGHQQPNGLKVLWGGGPITCTLDGVPPVRKTTEVHYHYNTSAIGLHFPNNIDDLSISI